ncbi:MAG: hypothetical protein KAV97_05695 [Actinomycetia bacterium]|nr:hypothetical protein [Actinomycetes bacterium]
MKCPFIYANGKQCNGYIHQIEIIKTDICITLDNDNNIEGFDFYPSRYHVHLYCSEKGDHSGAMRQHDERMKIWYSDLPDSIIENIELFLSREK